ncbi:MAG TPA: hypothetical protein VJB87_05165 [Candidatus Nanoarchaeia archaeon]|nr:hypothetical protein [Candidatus Nanoarchaeia archaeon]
MKWLLFSLLIIVAGCSSSVIDNNVDPDVNSDSCSDGSSCDSGWCVADLSPAQLRQVTDGGVIRTSGRCAVKSSGCFALVSNNQVDQVLCLDEE